MRHLRHQGHAGNRLHEVRHPVRGRRVRASARRVPGEVPGEPERRHRGRDPGRGGGRARRHAEAPAGRHRLLLAVQGARRRRGAVRHRGQLAPGGRRPRQAVGHAQAELRARRHQRLGPGQRLLRGDRGRRGLPAERSRRHRPRPDLG